MRDSLLIILRWASLRLAWTSQRLVLLVRQIADRFLSGDFVVGVLHLTWQAVAYPILDGCRKLNAGRGFAALGLHHIVQFLAGLDGGGDSLVQFDHKLALSNHHVFAARGTVAR